MTILELSPHTLEMFGRMLGAGFALGLGGIGAAVGMGIAAGQANEGIMRQPEQQGVMLRTMLIGQAVGGSPSIFALVIGLLILFTGSGPGLQLCMIMVGAGLSIGLGCFGSGLGCGYPAGAACDGVARNPRSASQITQGMIIGQAVAQSPSIFSAVIALMLLFVKLPFDGWLAAGIYIGAGLATGAAAMGPGLGSGQAAGGAVRAMGRWPKTYGLSIRTMLIGQAVCQTPAIFGLLVAFIMMFAMKDLEPTIIGFAKTFGAAVAVGFGGIGPGMGSGTTAEKACEATGLRPDKDALILRTMLIGQAVSQSTAIYGLIIALAMLVVVR